MTTSDVEELKRSNEAIKSSLAVVVSSLSEMQCSSSASVTTALSSSVTIEKDVVDPKIAQRIDALMRRVQQHIGANEAALAQFQSVALDLKQEIKVAFALAVHNLRARAAECSAQLEAALHRACAPIELTRRACANALELSLDAQDIAQHESSRQKGGLELLMKRLEEAEQASDDRLLSTPKSTDSIFADTSDTLAKPTASFCALITSSAQIAAAASIDVLGFVEESFDKTASSLSAQLSVPGNPSLREVQCGKVLGDAGVDEYLPVAITASKMISCDKLDSNSLYSLRLRAKYGANWTSWVVTQRKTACAPSVDSSASSKSKVALDFTTADIMANFGFSFGGDSDSMGMKALGLTGLKSVASKALELESDQSVLRRLALNDAAVHKSIAQEAAASRSTWEKSLVRGSIIDVKDSSVRLRQI